MATLLLAGTGVVSEIGALVMAAGWAGFAAILVIGRRGAAQGAARRDLKSTAGFLLQSVAYLVCLAFPRRYFSPLFPAWPATEPLLASAGIALTLASVWFCFAAARALGRQWALLARLIDGHQLVRQGPYAMVRNPIYLAMLGMLLSTGVAVSRWQVIPMALALFAAGTIIRIRTEENLLRAAFGVEFDDYVRAVPAFLPRRWR